MWSGTQFTGTIPGGATRRWFTFNWPASWRVVWEMNPTTVRPGAPQLDWDVAIERASVNYCTYWITVVNLTPDTVSFEGRFTVLN